MKRVEVEGQVEQQRRGQRHEREGRGDHRDPVALQKPIHRGQRGEAHRVRFRRRFQHHQQRRQQSNTGYKGDDHAGSGNLPELGEPPVRSRQK